LQAFSICQGCSPWRGTAALIYPLPDLLILHLIINRLQNFASLTGDYHNFERNCIRKKVKWWLTAEGYFLVAISFVAWSLSEPVDTVSSSRLHRKGKQSVVANASYYVWQDHSENMAPYH
jgi:hypothetical protein